LVRDEAKAADLKSKGVVVKIGDYLQYDTLVNAFKGVDKLLLVSSSDVEDRSLQQANAVKAAKEAGVKYILYTSFERKNDTESSPIAFISKSHLETEELIKIPVFLIQFSGIIFIWIIFLFLLETKYLKWEFIGLREIPKLPLQQELIWPKQQLLF
jgi:hypothetical protein